MDDTGGMLGRASGQGRVYQSSGDQYVSEHHHHYAESPLGLLTDLPSQRTVLRSRATAPDSVRVPLVGRIPVVLRDRSDLMPLLTEAVAGHGGVHVLHGLGGCGKTAIADAIFRRTKGTGNVDGLWVNASERVSFRSGMLAVAADRGARDGELRSAVEGSRAAADLVWHYLDHSPRPWLLVLDNADDPAILEDGGWLRPSPRGTVLVTTRHASHRVWNGAEMHHVDVLPEEDAALLLCDLAPDAGTPEQARTVARQLDCLPLALTLAGSFLGRQLLERWTMGEYEDRLRLNPAELIDQGAESQDSRQLIGRTWQISLDFLEAAGTPESVTLLRLLSCWDASPLPLTLLRSSELDAAGLPALDPALPGRRADAALRGLLAQSLVSLVSLDSPADAPEGHRAERYLRTHGILLDSVASGIPQEQRAPLVAAAVCLLAGEIPEGTTTAVAAGTVRLLAPHLEAVLRRVPDAETAVPAVELGARWSTLMFAAADYRAALSLAEAATATGGGLLGNEHVATLRAGHAAAMALFRLGSYEESERRHREVLRGRTNVLGAEHPETLTSLQELASPLSQAGSLHECIELLRQVDAARTRLLGAEHPDTLYTRAVLIEFLARSEAREGFDRQAARTVEACQQTLGEGHLTTVVARHNYAFGLYKFERWEEAEAAARAALDGRERSHGPDHSLTYSAQTLLSWVLQARGEFREAIEVARRALTGQERMVGEEHPYVLVNRAGLAASLLAAGERQEAGELAARNLDPCMRVLGPDDPATARTRIVLGEAQG
ncbi:tetratricopeptide repeat protein [Streptomyces sp. NPDC056240]|uniref:tetratricopeptide repeat protein n=1 Tax=Streptomyces sp. NPDC056240 TaxID=3345759 RepID=UPI0035DED2AF